MDWSLIVGRAWEKESIDNTRDTNSHIFYTRAVSPLLVVFLRRVQLSDAGARLMERTKVLVEDGGRQDDSHISVTRVEVEGYEEAQDGLSAVPHVYCIVRCSLRPRELWSLTITDEYFLSVVVAKVQLK